MAIGFPDDGGVVDAEKYKRRKNRSLHADLCASGGHAEFVGINPEAAGSIVDLIYALAEAADGLRHFTANLDFLIFVDSGIRVDVGNFLLVAGNGKEAEQQYGDEGETSIFHSQLDE